MRGGLELQGVLNLQRFVEQGGTLVTLTNSSNLPIHFGMAAASAWRTRRTCGRRAACSASQRARPASPLAYGYGDELGVYFGRTAARVHRRPAQPAGAIAPRGGAGRQHDGAALGPRRHR
jgi:hypothetical protein